jgi:hypothetical protein
MKRAAVLLVAVFAWACGGAASENSAACGFTAMAAATKALEQFRAGTKVLAETPPGLVGRVPVRVVGRGTRPGTVDHTADGPVVAYDGEGFPRTPGFGLVMVEDSTDTFKGVLIYDIDPPIGYPQLGMVAGDGHTIPLYGARVTWSEVSTPRCPLFAALDTAAAR